MKDEYIIISKTAIQKRIEEMECKLKQHHKWCQKTGNVYDYQYEANILELKQILSQSTPLIPEIEKAFDAGSERGEHGYGNANDKQDYISNLNLNL